MRTRKISRLLLAVGLLLCTVTACGPEESQLVKSLFEEWADEKGFKPTDENGNLDFWKTIGTIGKVATAITTGSTGDAEADAAVEILSVVYPIKSYDEQTDKGLDTRDPAQIQNAINGRPNDYHYRNAMGVVQLANGQEDTAEAWFTQAGQTWTQTNPNWSPSYGTQANSRDIMGCIDRAIKAEDTNGTSEAGKHSLRKRYCSEAKWYQATTGSDHYLNHASYVLKVNCYMY